MKIVSYFSDSSQDTEHKTTGKFLQLIWRGEEYLIFAAANLYQYHTQILTRFLDDHQIPYKALEGGHILVKDSLLNVKGGGKFQLDESLQTLNLRDNSQAFGRFEEKGLGKKIANSGHRWKTFTIHISE